MRREGRKEFGGRWMVDGRYFIWLDLTWLLHLLLPLLLLGGWDVMWYARVKGNRRVGERYTHIPYTISCPKKFKKRRKILSLTPFSLSLLSVSSLPPPPILPERPPYTKIQTPKKKEKERKKKAKPPFLTSSLLSKVDNRFHISTPIHLRQLDQQFGFIPQCKHFTTLNPILTLGIQF